MGFNIFNPKKSPQVSNENSKDHLTEEIKTKPSPVRGSGGRFVSSKKRHEEKEKQVSIEEKQIKSSKTEVATPGEAKPKTESSREFGSLSQTPTKSTFYGKEVRRFYYNGNWYFAIDDIISCAAADSLNEQINFGDQEELDKVRPKIALQFEYEDNTGEYTVEAALASDLIEIMPLIRGIFPGPFKRWITETSAFPPPFKTSDIIKPGKTDSAQIHPSDTGN